MTTPLKWVLADAPCKVSMIALTIAPILSQEMQDYAKTLILTRRFVFSRHQLGLRILIKSQLLLGQLAFNT